MSEVLTMDRKILVPPEVAREKAEAEKAKTIPKPSGWKILCILSEAEEKFEGTSLVKPDSFIKGEEASSTVLFVLDVGPDAYKDEKKFPNGPWCKKGDFVMVRTYSGTRFKVHGREMRLLNDDQIEAVVEDPRGVTRV